MYDRPVSNGFDQCSLLYDRVSVSFYWDYWEHQHTLSTIMRHFKLIYICFLIDNTAF
jgi:hypothetical protein